MLRRLRNFWIPGVATLVLGCFSNAVAQTSYKITDLGINVGSSRVDLQACKLEYSIVSPK